jgi:hypothetical protein
MLLNWENIKKTARNEVSDAAATIWKYLKIGKSRLDRLNTNKSLNKTYRELGIETDKQINDDAKQDIRKNPKVINMINKIKVFKQDIIDNKLKIKTIRKGSVIQPKMDEVIDHRPEPEREKRSRQQK